MQIKSGEVWDRINRKRKISSDSYCIFYMHTLTSDCLECIGTGMMQDGKQHLEN